jgi:hypothetical protein
MRRPARVFSQKLRRVRLRESEMKAERRTGMKNPGELAASRRPFCSSSQFRIIGLEKACRARRPERYFGCVEDPMGGFSAALRDANCRSVPVPRIAPAKADFIRGYFQPSLREERD